MSNVILFPVVPRPRPKGEGVLWIDWNVLASLRGPSGFVRVATSNGVAPDNLLILPVIRVERQDPYRDDVRGNGE